MPQATCFNGSRTDVDPQKYGGLYSAYMRTIYNSVIIQSNRLSKILYYFAKPSHMDMGFLIFVLEPPRPTLDDITYYGIKEI